MNLRKIDGRAILRAVRSCYHSMRNRVIFPNLLKERGDDLRS